VTSVVIPCYNSADDVGEAIGSVLQQTRDDYVQEIVVVDDGSTDHSEEVIRSWEDHDERVRYIYQENQGPSVARNRGVAEVNSQYIAFLDADDLWKSEKLERQLSFLNDHPDVALVCSDYLVEQKGERSRMRARHLDYRHEDVLERLYLRGGPVLMSTVIIKKGVFQQIGGFDPSIPIGQDTDLWLRIAAEHSIHHLSVPLTIKRSRSDSVSEDMVEKVKYLRTITDRLADQYSRLESLQEQRQAILSGRLARFWLRRGNREKAWKEALRALRENPTSIHAFSFVALTMMPLPTPQIIQIVQGLGKVRKSLTGLKTALFSSMKRY
jgi:glycosyltransferase involved in cell wall biosynthesis